VIFTGMSILTNKVQNHYFNVILGEPGI